MAQKIDSNVTGLRFAEEASLGVLPGSPVWHPLEPNGYRDFGSQTTTMARNPISQSRQRLKGVVTDLDASGGLMQDLTFTNTLRILQSFFFAALRQKKSSAPMNGAAVAVTSVTSGTKTYAAVAGLDGFAVGAIVLASGFATAGNNGLKTVASSAAAALVVTETVVTEASPPAAAKIETVGFKLGSGTSAIAMNGNLVRLTDSATNLTTLGLIPGEWVYIGSDTAGERFANNAGHARVSVIASGYLEFDKVTWTPGAETGTGKTITMFFGSVLKNESDPNLITKRTIQLERTLGEDGSGTMSEYLVGAVANELTINIPLADKVTVDMGFVAINNEQRDGLLEVKAGSRPDIVFSDAINTSSDLNRIHLALVSDTDATVTPLFAYATEATVTINNGVTPDKAVAVLGAFDTSSGNFEVGGSLTAYFSDIAAVQAVRNNADITMDIISAKSNRGFVIDIPLLSLGNGRLAVEQNKSITLPLDMTAGKSKFNTTMLYMDFPYLPNQASV